MQRRLQPIPGMAAAWAGTVAAASMPVVTAAPSPPANRGASIVIPR